VGTDSSYDLTVKRRSMRQNVWRIDDRDQWFWPCVAIELTHSSVWLQHIAYSEDIEDRLCNGSCGVNRALMVNVENFIFQQLGFGCCEQKRQQANHITLKPPCYSECLPFMHNPIHTTLPRTTNPRINTFCCVRIFIAVSFYLSLICRYARSYPGIPKQERTTHVELE